MVKAKAAGQFLGGILNNPFVAILLLGVGALLIFREPILRGFSSIGESLGDINISLPEIKFPEFNFPEITFPEFNFPELPDFSSIFGGFQDQLSSIAGQVVELQGAQVTIPPDTMIDPETGIVTSETPPTIESTTGKGTDLSTLFGELRPQVFDTLVSSGLSFKEAAIQLRDITTIQGLGDLLNKFNLAGLEPIKTTVLEPKPIQSFLVDEPTQQFTGGGISFTGGSIFETPIQNLSLSQIIDKFMVTASQAANLKAIATGFSPEEEEFLKGSQDIGGFFTGFNPPAVSDPQFAGLTPEQIALQLTGGNISNF